MLTTTCNRKKIYVLETNDVWFDYLIQSFLHYTCKNRISKVINFVYSTELEKYVFRLVKCVERRRNSKFPCRKVLEKKVHLSNHGWTQKQVNKADKASILIIKYWGQLQVKRMKKVKIVLYAWLDVLNWLIVCFSLQINFLRKVKFECEKTKMKLNILSISEIFYEEWSIYFLLLE